MTLRPLALVLLVSFVSRAEDAPLKNLQVFPKDISRPALIQEMRRFSFATGYRCEGCHVGKSSGSEDSWDFPSDDKETKRTARAMLRMVLAINADYVGKLGRADALKVECVTCHRGIAKPETLDHLLLGLTHGNGVDAAIARYRELRRRYYGSAAYDFGDLPLDLAGETLLKEGRAKDAVRILELNVENGTKEVWSHTLLSDARLAAGDKAGAKAALDKALTIDPGSDWLKKKKQDLDEPAK
jgi:hypothetical protein